MAPNYVFRLYRYARLAANLNVRPREDRRKERIRAPDAALCIHRDAPRTEPPREKERARVGAGPWVRDDLWLYRVRSLRSQSFPLYRIPP